MDAAEAKEFLRENHRAVLATMRRHGRAQLSPVVVAVDDDGQAVISSRETAMKTMNLRRDPRGSLCVMNDALFGRWIQIDGTASIVSLPDAMPRLEDYYRRVAGEHPDWDDYRAAMERERRVVIRIEIERVGPTRSG